MDFTDLHIAKSSEPPPFDMINTTHVVKFVRWISARLKHSIGLALLTASPLCVLGTLQVQSAPRYRVIHLDEDEETPLPQMQWVALASD
jgi:hypothetical protein